MSEVMEDAQVYCIAWEHKDTHRKGRGTKRFSCKEAAELCRELNADYPHIEHWIETMP